MAIIPQQKLFDYKEIEELGDLERLRLVLEYLPDEELMRKLEQERGHGRDDYKIRAMWNSIIAGIVYQHPTNESLRRELGRNGQLRAMCGFSNTVPPVWVYSRFIKKIMKNEEEIEKIFERLVKQLKELLPDYGRRIAIDGKEINSFGNYHKKKKERDGRRDIDADFGKKVYRGRREDGSLWEKVKRWFGYKLHLLVDVEYELPIEFEITKASVSEAPQAHQLIEKANKKHPEIIRECEIILADRGYDDKKLIKKVWDEYKIKPVIEIRKMWKDGEETRLLGNYKNIVYDYRGTVYCYCAKSGKQREMAYGGFEKERESLKYRCPAEHYGIECQGKEECPIANSIRIKLSEERRVFTPLARSSYSWAKEYKARTAVERVNSRLDVGYGFEHHTIRGKKKMKMRCSIAMIVMLTMAVGRIKENQEDKMRSLVKPA